MVSAPANQVEAPLLPPDVGYMGAGRVVSSSNTLMVVGFLRKELILTSTCLRYSSLNQASQYSRLPQVLDTRKNPWVVQRAPGLAVEVALPPDGLAAQIAKHVPYQDFVAGFYLPFDEDLNCHSSLLVTAGLDCVGFARVGLADRVGPAFSVFIGVHPVKNGWCAGCCGV